ncbi:MAG TPA: hypothetical protein VKZ79_23770 [Alphaproteobacteria bacterium]|nr:hypothetical protein [Alphaproteobacteria bacterium]
MEHLALSLHRFLWFLDQAVHVGGLGILYFLIPLAFLILTMMGSFPRDRPTRRRLRDLLWIPVIWIAVGLWGAWFWYDAQSPDAARNPEWVRYPVDAALPIILVLDLYLIWRSAGARRFTAAYMLINLYFTLSISFLAGMAVTGNWL